MRSFLLIRIKRLGPLYLLGAILGLVSLFFGSHGAWRGQALFEGAALNLLGLPAIHLVASGEAFPLNPPFWSLFLELWVANLAFGLLWRHLRGVTLYALVAGSAVALVLAERAAHTMNIGWSVSDVPAGLARVGFSFFAGVAVARLHTKWPPRLNVPPYLLLLVACGTLIAPLATGVAQAFGLFSTLLSFPALVYLGAVQWERAPRVGSWLGDASYALYAIHAPLVHILAVVAGGAVVARTVGAEVAFCFLMVCVALQAARWDEALRATWERPLTASLRGGSPGSSRA